MKYDATIKHALIVLSGNDLALELSLSIKKDQGRQETIISVPSEDLLNTLRFLFMISGAHDLSDLEGEIISVRVNSEGAPDAIAKTRSAVFWYILK